MQLRILTVLVFRGPLKNARIQHRAVEQLKEESPLSDLKGSDAES